MLRLDRHDLTSGELYDEVLEAKYAAEAERVAASLPPGCDLAPLLALAQSRLRYVLINAGGAARAARRSPATEPRRRRLTTGAGTVPAPIACAPVVVGCGAWADGAGDRRAWRTGVERHG